MPASSSDRTPHDMRTVRALLWIQTALYAVTSGTYLLGVIGVLQMGNASLVSPLVFALAALTIAATVGAGTAAATVSQRRPKTWWLILVVEGLMALESLNKLAGTESGSETVGVLIRLGVIAAVVVLVMRPSGRAHFDRS